MNELLFITSNANKLAEVHAIIGEHINLKSQSLDLTEIQGSIEDVSKDKCQRAAQILGLPVLVEDTCLCFKAWKELPGPYIKWFLQELGPDQLYKLLSGFEDKSAEAVCTFALSTTPSSEPILFQGRTEGTIVAARGPRHFGWDSAFEVEGRTYAEMTKLEKNQVSHRGRALKKLQEWLKSNTVNTSDI